LPNSSTVNGTYRDGMGTPSDGQNAERDAFYALFLYEPSDIGGPHSPPEGHRKETHQVKKLISLLILSLALVLLVACGSDDENPQATASTAAAAATGNTTPNSEPITLRLGYFANITHSQPLVGLNNGFFQEELGDNVTIEAKTFNAGPSVIEALFAGEIDASFIGPNPAINGYIQSGGEALRIVAGATSGGALFVVDPDSGITQSEDLNGKKIATPQLGNTQDVALRAWLIDQGLGAKESGGKVNVKPIANSDTLALFQQGSLDGAWVPEPWGTRLIQEAGAKVFLNESELWPDGKYVTTHLIVSTDFLEKRPDVVEGLVRATVKTTEWINDNPEEAKTLVNSQIEKISGAALPKAVIDAAWENIEITYDPIASSLVKSAEDAFELGYLEEEPDLDGIYALDILDSVLQDEGLPPVER
jgi:NitT/TauT family transport system substrate-binding protein